MFLDFMAVLNRLFLSRYLPPSTAQGTSKQMSYLEVITLLLPQTCSASSVPCPGSDSVFCTGTKAINAYFQTDSYSLCLLCPLLFSVPPTFSLPLPLTLLAPTVLGTHPFSFSLPLPHEGAQVCACLTNVAAQAAPSPLCPPEISDSRQPFVFCPPDLMKKTPS